MQIKENVKSFFKTPAVYICLLLTAIYILSGFNKWFEVAIPIVAFFCFVFLPLKQGLCVFVYLQCYGLSNISYCSHLVATLACYTAALLIKYVYGLYQKKYPIYKSLIIAILCFTICSSIISFFNLPIFQNAVTYLCYLPLFYFIFAMRKDFDINLVMKYLFAGLVCSCLIAFIFDFIPAFEYYPYWPGHRFTAFTSCPNYLYMRGLVLLTYFMVLSISNKLNFYKFIVYYIICSVIILSTISKTALVLLALFTFVYIILYAIKDSKKHLKNLLIFALILLVVVAISHRFIFNILNRITSSNFGTNEISKLTTGRVDIWKEYLTQWLASPFSFLFGKGMFSAKLFIPALDIKYDTHSFFVMLIYRFGIVGILALIYIAYLFIRNLNKTKPNPVAYLPLVWFIIESLTDNTFQPNNIFMLILVCMILFSFSQEKSPTTNKEQKRIKKDL